MGTGAVGFCAAPLEDGAAVAAAWGKVGIGAGVVAATGAPDGCGGGVDCGAIGVVLGKAVGDAPVAPNGLGATFPKGLGFGAKPFVGAGVRLVLATPATAGITGAWPEGSLSATTVLDGAGALEGWVRPEGAPLDEESAGTVDTSGGLFPSACTPPPITTWVANAVGAELPVFGGTPNGDAPVAGTGFGTVPPCAACVGTWNVVGGCAGGITFAATTPLEGVWVPLTVGTTAAGG